MTALQYDRTRVFLTGFMGSGKSTIGPILANTLGYKFVDLDKLIEEQAGRRIVEIFETMGEAAFRSLEKKVLAEVSSATECVISLGGGTTANDENFKLIRQSGALVYLKLSPNEVLRRLSHKTDRPMLKDEYGATLTHDVLQTKVLTLLQHREAYYNQADIVVPTDELSVGKTVDEIVRKLKSSVERSAHPLQRQESR